MSKPKVFISRRIPQPGLDIVEKVCEVEMNPEDRVLSKDELKEGVKGKEGLLCLLTDTVDAEIMDSSEALKVIANYAVGYNNIDIEEAAKRGILVTNTPGVLTDTTADLTWALLMAVARRIVEADRFVREGKFQGWAPMLFLGGDIYNKTLGIIGLGRIGKAVARRAKGFGMKIIYTDVKRVGEREEQELGARFVSKEDLLKEADFVTLHVPLLPETKHYIGSKELKMMKKTAYLINVARGPIVDEKAMVGALRRGEIAGAGLDVYEEEPHLTEGLIDLDNVVIVPHIGSASIETRTKMAVMAATNLTSPLQGQRPLNLVNPEVWSR